MEGKSNIVAAAIGAIGAAQLFILGWVLDRQYTIERDSDQEVHLLRERINRLESAPEARQRLRYLEQKEADNTARVALIEERMDRMSASFAETRRELVNRVCPVNE